MSYFKNEHGIECYDDTEYGNLYIKNKRGSLFIVNRTKAYAKKKGLRVVYKTSDGKIIIAPHESQKRRINRKIRRARELQEFMDLMKWNGVLRLMKDDKWLSDERTNDTNNTK